MTTHADVLVVGAGLSGLYAARILQRAGLTVAILEARDRIGGRVLSQRLSNGTTVDLGGQWIGPGQKRVYALASEYGLKTIVTHTQGDNIFLADGKCQRTTDVMPPMSVPGKLDTLKLSWQLDRLIKQIAVVDPCQHQRTKQLDKQSFREWLQQNASSKEARAFWLYVAEEDLCASADRFSPLEWLQQLATLGGLEGLEKSGHEFFADGAQNLAQCMASELGDCIHTNTPVQALKRHGQFVQVTTARGEFFGKRVILALPPQLIESISFDDSLTNRPVNKPKDRILGQITKTLIVYDHAWWRDRGLSGAASTPTELISTLMDSSGCDGKPGILAAFSSGQRAVELSLMDDETRKTAVLSYVEKVLGKASGQLIDIVSMDWTSEKWSQGGYASRRAIGGWSEPEHTLTSPFNGIHFASAETATEWRSFMEGALQSGERAGKEVLNALSAEAIESQFD